MTKRAQNKSSIDELLGTVGRLVVATARLKPKGAKSSAISAMLAAVSQLTDATARLAKESETSAPSPDDYLQRHSATGAEHLNRGKRLLNAEIGQWSRSAGPFWKRS